jgi:DNA modification methylase
MREEIIGDCRLILGDCLEVMPTLGKVDAVVTDPPYEFVPMGGGLGAKMAVYKEIYAANLHKGFDVNIFKDVSDSLIICCSKQQFVKIIKFSEENGYRWQLITFNKTNPPPLVGKNYLPDAEYIFHLWKNCELGGEIKDKSRFFIGSVSDGKVDHPSPKPIKLMIKLVRLSRRDGGVVLDPFMGSGTTGLACIAERRPFIGIEMNEKYFDLSCRRIEEAYKQPDLFIEQPVKHIQDKMI